MKSRAPLVGAGHLAAIMAAGGLFARRMTARKGGAPRQQREKLTTEATETTEKNSSRFSVNSVISVVSHFFGSPGRFANRPYGRSYQSSLNANCITLGGSSKPPITPNCPGVSEELWGAELDVIPGVVKLGTEFRVQALVDRGALKRGDIPVVEAGFFQAVALRSPLQVEGAGQFVAVGAGMPAGHPG